MITIKGKLKLELKLEELKKQLDYTVEEKRKAAQEGDLRENAAYHYLGTQVDLIRNQISEIEDTLKMGKIIARPGQNNKISHGHKIQVKFEDGRNMAVTIVGKYDSNIEPGWISYESPLAVALLGKMATEVVNVNDRQVTIVAIESGDID